MKITDEFIRSLEQDVDTNEPIPLDERSLTIQMRNIQKTLQANPHIDIESEEFLALFGKHLAPYREYLGGTEAEGFLGEAFTAADKRKAAGPKKRA